MRAHVLKPSQTLSNCRSFDGRSPVAVPFAVPPATTDSPLRFGRFEISAAERVLRVDGQAAALGARAFDLLLALAQRRERMVSKQELLDLVWPGLVVEEHNIAAQISSLRKVLGPHAIATVPGRGYQFVAADAALVRDGAAAVPPPDQRVAAPALHATAGAPARRGNLPEQRTRFIGRETELAELAWLLRESRLLTLTGIGGAGKTRLALQLAQQQAAAFAEGVWFVDLAPLADAERVAPACAAALGVELDASDAPPAERLAAALAGKPQRELLIVLDNCEHVHAGAAAVADAMLARAGRVRLLATSREPLALAGEQVYPLRSLSLPATSTIEDVRAADAARVFVDRARLVQPQFHVDAGNAAPLAEICRRLDGIALAIELAAARVTVLSVAEIAARLEDRFRLLTGGHASAARQQTLLATMQWSHDLLDPAAQRLLRRLAVFAGGCTLPAACAVAQAGDEYETLALLSQLHDKSLLVVERGGSDTGADEDSGGAPPRYRMLETVRQYAQRQLEASGEAEACRARHAEHCVRLAEAAQPFLRGPQQSLWMARLRAEHENLVAALRWCARSDAAAAPAARASWGLRIAAATGRYWLFHDVELGCHLLAQALQRAPADAEDAADADTAARFFALHGLAAMHMHRGQGDAGLPLAQQALALAQAQGNTEWQAVALASLGACVRPDDEDLALAHYERARDLAEASASAVPLAAALNNIAAIECRRGQLEPAVGNFRQSLKLTRASGDVRAALITLHNLVRVLVAAERPAEARVCAIEAEALLGGVAEPPLKLELLEVVAGLASSLGEHAVAARLWGATLERFTESGYLRPAEDEDQLQRLLARSRAALGLPAFRAAADAGATLPVDVAMIEARRWLDAVAR